MSEAKFSKGPWEIIENQFCDSVEITSASRVGMVSIAEVKDVYLDGVFDNYFEEEQFFNAHLITAAPEMYEMLQALVDGDSINDSSIDLEVLSLLAKARGETK